MATTEEIRRKLQEQATQRVNPLLKGLSMLTGGIAGEFTGTNEQIRQQRLARRAIMEEDLAALQEERMMQRMKAQQDEMLKRQLQVEEAQRLAATRARVLEARGQANVYAGQDVMGPLEPAEQLGMETARASLEAKRPEMAGYLAAQKVQLGEPDIDTLRFIYNQQKTKEEMQKEAERKKSGYMQFNLPGYGTIGAPLDQINSLRQDPFLGPLLSKLGTEESPFTSSVGLDMETSSPTIRLGFKSGTTPEKQAEITAQIAKAFGAQFQGAAAPAPGVPKPEDQKRKTDIPGYTVRPKM